MAWVVAGGAHEVAGQTVQRAGEPVFGHAPGQQHQRAGDDGRGPAAGPGSQHDGHPQGEEKPSQAAHHASPGRWHQASSMRLMRSTTARVENGLVM
jgi:hypothetical protein